MANETATLAAYVASLKFEDIPAEVPERAKVLTLDLLGSAIRAIVLHHVELVGQRALSRMAPASRDTGLSREIKDAAHSLKASRSGS